MEPTNIDEELEQVFGKLKQLRVGQLRTGRRRKTSRTNEHSSTENREEATKHKETIHQTIKPERKSVIKEGKLRLPKSFISKQTTKVMDSKCDQCFEKQINEETTNDKPVAIRRSCSTEFRNAELLIQGYKQESIDDTSPDELAAYMEQVLHFPKPMSAMAEMMYG